MIREIIQEAKFKDQLIEKYEVIIRVDYQELIVEVGLPASTGRWTMDSKNVNKIQDKFECKLITYFWSKKEHMISAITKATKADEVEVNRIK